MVQITGKYQLVKSDNFSSHLISMGVPEEKARNADSQKTTLDFKHNGNKIAVDIDYDVKVHVDLILNEEVDEKISPEYIIKTTSSLNGDTLTLKSKHPSGKTETKIHNFTDTGLTLIFQDDDPATPDAVRVFKRL